MMNFEKIFKLAFTDWHVWNEGGTNLDEWWYTYRFRIKVKTLISPSKDAHNNYVLKDLRVQRIILRRVQELY